MFAPLPSDFVPYGYGQIGVGIPGSFEGAIHIVYHLFLFMVRITLKLCRKWT